MSTETKSHLSYLNELQKNKCYLHFQDGTVFSGFINLEQNDSRLSLGILGEAAFTTGMSGYIETLTDPSFLGQHLIFTTSHIGNYEDRAEAQQSSCIHASSIIARNISECDFIKNSDTPLITGLDTRSLVKYLTTRSKEHKSVITLNKELKGDEFKNRELICNRLDLVSVKRPEVLSTGEKPIVVIDYGVKESILRNLKNLKRPIVLLPYNTTASEVMSYNPRLIFLSNGPGNPKEYTFQVQQVRKLLQSNTPIRGICLGHQLLALALGAQTYKLPFGQRGMNHPLLDHKDGNILISSQNHGYSIEEESFEKIKEHNEVNKEFYIEYSSLFDQSIEGISSTDSFIKTVQFHPEANPGPHDTAVFFKEIESYLNYGSSQIIQTDKLHTNLKLHSNLKKDIKYRRILLVGSGPIKIGQASEFDYSGTQACKALKEIGIEVVLLNSNPATIMTDEDMAYRTYIEPITKETIKKIIEKENVDAVLSTMGGQTALNICIELEQEDYLKNKGVELLGASVDTINKTENRDLFASELQKLGYKAGKRFHAQTPDEVISVATQSVQFPLIIRRDFALGGKGAVLVKNTEQLEQTLRGDIKYPVTMEKSLLGWKEVELEVMVDKNRNGVIICSIENIDPCGIHTGDSITVAPAQTLSDHCYQNLRTISLNIAKHMGVVAGGANVQFAINPEDEDDIIVIEMNPRVSRSSALASKATGYPIAKISALLAIGYHLSEILNDITKSSPVCFEPSLDYVAVKIPVFPFNKFPSSSKTLGPQMRSVGEVLALGGNFNEAFMKALRSTEVGLEIPKLEQLRTTPLDIDWDYLEQRLKNPYQLSLLTVMEALRQGRSIDYLNEITGISSWFITQVQLIIELENELKKSTAKLYNPDNLRRYKENGLSDKHLAILSNLSQGDILKFRIESNTLPVYKAVDTCSGEFDAKTPYFYSTYASENEAHPLSKHSKSTVILGSGPNRIGQGIEFDYSCVKACKRLQTKNIKAIMINSNPETVSTDYDSSDRLYLSPLFSEDLFDIFCSENPDSIITSFSGQTGINIREHIEANFRTSIKSFNFLGPTIETLRLTEDRDSFYQVTKKVPLSHTESRQIRGHKNLLTAISEIGLPVIIRPSFVIGGESMYIFHTHEQLETLPAELRRSLKDSSTVFQVETYLEGAYEYDVDLVRDRMGNTSFSICEHIEYAGVHSGDSGMITPPIHLKKETYSLIKKISKQISDELQVTGPINYQFAVKDDQVFCIEANPRGSRTIPFLSKATQTKLPEMATDALLGELIPEIDTTNEKIYCVKQSTFPFDRFVQDNIILGPKMRSTGETLGLDRNIQSATLKSYLGNYPHLNKKGKALFSLSDSTKKEILPLAIKLESIGTQLFATKGTYDFFKENNLNPKLVSKVDEGSNISENSLLQLLKEDDMRVVFNTPKEQGRSKSDGERIRNTAIQYAIPCFTQKENIANVINAIVETNNELITPLALQEI